MVDFISNVILGISLALPLGPITLEILRRGLLINLKESLMTATGSFSAELTYFTLIYLGLSKFSESFVVKYVFGFLGVGFLFYLGYENLNDYFSKSKKASAKIMKRNGFLSGYLITFLNPSNFFMWVGIIGASFVNSSGLFASSGILVGILPSLFFYAGLSALGTKMINKKRLSYISLIAGTFLIFYGLKLLSGIIE